MITDDSRGLRTRDASRAGVFAVAGAALIRQLAIRRSGEDLRQGLNAMTAYLQDGGVRLTVKEGALYSNDVLVPPQPSAEWLTPLTASGVVEVEFEEGTTARELLLFLALLVAPGDAAAFAGTWLTSGSWRIHVTTSTGLPVAEDPSPGPRFGDQSLAALVEAVARGDALVAGSTLHESLRTHGAAATEALLQELTRCATGSQRRLFFNAIVAVGEGAEHLVAALQHADWRVVRNAVALLGELQVSAATPHVAAACTHAEYRVRMAAATALGQLDSPDAHRALLAMVNDSDAQVRARAWTSLGHAAVSPPAAVLDAALRRQDEPAVQHAMLACAAAFPDLDISGGLIRFCAREFSRSAPRELLVFAVEQLALRRPDSAKAFVSRLPDRLARSA